jgi:hypothetical protein
MIVWRSRPCGHTRGNCAASSTARAWRCLPRQERFRDGTNRDLTAANSVIPLMQPTSPGPDAAPTPARLERIAPFIAAAVAFVVGVWAFRPYAVGIYMDDGVYMILAKSIATGHGLRNLHLPGSPIATHFPPGFPLLLAALWRFNPDFPKNIELFLLLQAALLSAVTVGTYVFGRRVLGWRPALALAVSFGATLSLPLLSLGAVLWSEVFSLALLMPFLVRSDRLVRDRVSSRDALLLGAYAGVIALVRTQLVFVVPAMCAVLMLRRQWRPMLIFAGTMLCFVIPWQVWTAAHDAGVQGLLRGYYGSYGAWLATGIRTQGAHLVTTTLRINARDIMAIIAVRVAPWSTGTLRVSALLLAAAAMIFGSFRMWKRAPITVLFAAVYAAVVFVWPFYPWRFVWGLWPVFLLIGAFGAAQAIDAAKKSSFPGLRFAPVLASAALVIGIFRAESLAYHSRAWSTPVKQQVGYVEPLVGWVKRNTQPTDLLVADDEPLVYLFTGRQAMPPVPFTAEEYIRARTRPEEAQALDDLLRRYSARYVVTVVPSTRDAARSMAGTDASRLRELQELPNGAAFAVR